jgi:hypothetical protein
MRQRIEGELDPSGPRSQRAAAPEPVDAEWTRHEVAEFAELARSGAYLAGDRRVKPSERTRWRFTFQRLIKESEVALRDGDIDDGAAAMEILLDLAQEMRGFDYFRSGDPIEAARVVVSDEAALLWSRVREQLGFREFARYAAPQFVRWESQHGWTRTGYGRTSEKETTLATVLAGMLSAPDMWVAFADAYIEALDILAADVPGSTRRGRSPDRSREDRTRSLAKWHMMLLDQLLGTDDENRLDRLAEHPALGGPDRTYFRAQLANRRGDLATARRSITEALERLPGHKDYLQLAREIGVTARADARTVSLRPTTHEPTGPGRGGEGALRADHARVTNARHDSLGDQPSVDVEPAEQETPVPPRPQ